MLNTFFRVMLDDLWDFPLNVLTDTGRREYVMTITASSARFRPDELRRRVDHIYNWNETLIPATAEASAIYD